MTLFSLDAARDEANVAGNRLPRFDPAADPSTDPYPTYALYREHDPVHWGLPHDPRLPGVWYLFSHADCSHLLRLSVDAPDTLGGMPSKLGWGFGQGVPDEAADYFAIRKSFLTAQDPPDHARMRGVLTAFFTPKAIEAFRPRLESIVESMIEDILAGPATFDFVAQIAYPLPLIVISELMGVPVEDRELVHELSATLGRGFDVDGSFDRALSAADAARRFRAYLGPVFEDRDRHPVDDIISGIIKASSRDGGISRDEMYGIVSVLIQGGQTTTMGLLGGGTLELLLERDEFHRLCSDPGYLAIPATEELLRWVSPAQAPPPRWVYQDVEIGDKLIRRGEVVQPMIGSANRDEAAFANADRLDLSRKPNPHLAFGGGIHRCLGSSLARLQGQVVFRQLAKRMPDLQLDEDSERSYLDRRVVRALTRLPVELPR